MSLALALYLAGASITEASVVCLHGSAGGTGGYLVVRDACPSDEEVLGSFDGLRLLLATLSREDGATLRLTGVNLQIVSGTGDTYASRNGRGNLILGYNVGPGVGSLPNRNGSHNLVIGDQHAYYGSGGLLAGFANLLISDKASVLGGSFNAASELGTVAGGFSNGSSGLYATVCGGRANNASGLYASVAGGLLNRATGQNASVSGGFENFARDANAVVSGGACNIAGSPEGLDLSACAAARPFSPVVSGGKSNRASGEWSVVGGGEGVVVPNEREWHAGQSPGFPNGRGY